jgi:hypothetical protein
MGLFMAAGFSTLAAAILIVLAVRLAASGPMPSGGIGEAARMFGWIVASYFGGFTLAGLLVGLSNELPLGPLRYPAVGFLCGACIYGGVGVAMELGGLFPADGSTLSGWRLVGFMTVVMGTIWALGFSVWGTGRWLIRWALSRLRSP